MTTLSQALSEQLREQWPSCRLVSATKLEKHMTVLRSNIQPRTLKLRTMDTRSTRVEQQESRLLILNSQHGLMQPPVSSRRILPLTQISLPQTVQHLPKRLNRLRMQLHGLLTQKRPVFAPRSLWTRTNKQLTPPPKHSQCKPLWHLPRVQKRKMPSLSSQLSSPLPQPLELDMSTALIAKYLLAPILRSNSRWLKLLVPVLWLLSPSRLQPLQLYSELSQSLVYAMSTKHTTLAWLFLARPPFVCSAVNPPPFVRVCIA